MTDNQIDNESFEAFFEYISFSSASHKPYLSIKIKKSSSLGIEKQYIESYFQENFNNYENLKKEKFIIYDNFSSGIIIKFLKKEHFKDRNFANNIEDKDENFIQNFWGSLQPCDRNFFNSVEDCRESISCIEAFKNKMLEDLKKEAESGKDTKSIFSPSLIIDFIKDLFSPKAKTD